MYSVQVINLSFEFLKIDVFERTWFLFYLWYFEKYVVYIMFHTMGLGILRNGVLTIIMSMALYINQWDGSG